MIRKEKNGVVYYQFEQLSTFDNIKHFVSTRLGGVSQPPFESLNISLRSGDSKDSVIENRKRLAEAVDIPLDYFCLANQTHSNKVAYLNGSKRQYGVYKLNTALGDTDGMLTSRSNICLTAQSADCVPILLYDTKTKAIAAVHAGWRGTVKRIVQIALQEMILHLHAKAQNILACIGPSISPKVYEVGEEVVSAVGEEFEAEEEFLVWNEERSKYHFDLWHTNKYLLTSMGVLENHIEIAQVCTYQNSDVFFSARKEKSKACFMSGIVLL